MTRESSKGRHYKQETTAGRNTVSILASISILAFIFVLCLGAPLALADAGSTAVAAGSEAASALTAEQATADPAVDAAITSQEAGDAPVAAAQAQSVDPSGDAAGADAGNDGSGYTDNTDASQAGSTGESGSDAEPDAATAFSEAGVAVAADAGTGDCDAAAAAGTQTGAGCEPEYKLDLICSWGDNGTYWDSVDDYQAGLLSILYHLENNGTGPAYNLNITSATATNGVTLATELTSIVLGDLGTGEAVNFILKWLVPKNVGHYVTTVEICADCEQPVCPEEECPPPDPCELDPESCLPVDPCIENPELCQPVDPCIENPTLCNPIDPGDIGPTPTETTATVVAPTLTRSELPSTGMGMLPGAIAALALLAIGALIPLSMRGYKSES